MKRRHFVKSVATKGVMLPSIFSGFFLKAFAASPLVQALQQSDSNNNNVLVLIQLNGGNDGLNTVIPIDQYANLYSARPQVILPETSLLPLAGYDTVKLHPAMGGMRNLFNEGKVKIVQSVGYPNQNFSHFRSTDIWLSGSDANQYLPTGWMGRYLHYEYPNYPAQYPNETMPDPLAVEIGGSQSLGFMGPNTGMAYSIADPNFFYEFVSGIQTPAAPTPAGEQLDYVRLISRQSQVYGQRIKDASDAVTAQASYPDGNNLAQQLRIVARLIAGGLQTRVYMVHIGGFDTHDSQVEDADHTIGEHATLLNRLSEAVSAFQNDLQTLNIADRVLTMTFSEFGRRIKANSSLGTDHGAAAPMFLIGNGVFAGILGNNPTIPPFVGVEDNLPMQYDFRSVYATVLRDWFCVPSADLEGVMLQAFPVLPLIAASDCVTVATHEANQQSGLNILHIAPNPFNLNTRLQFTSSGSNLLIQVFNSQGQLVQTLANGWYEQGAHSLHWDTYALPKGVYYCRLQDGFRQQVKAVAKM